MTEREETSRIIESSLTQREALRRRGVPRRVDMSVLYPLLGGEGLEHGVSQSVIEEAAKQEANTEKGPNGL